MQERRSDEAQERAGKNSRHDRTDGKPFERGREWFSITYHEDGQRTVRAQCELDDRQLLRDVVYTISPDMKPLDCFVRLHRAGRFLGSGWCRFTDTEAECEVFNNQMGRVSQRVPLGQRAAGFGTHPVNCDALLLAAFDHSKPDRIQPARGVLDVVDATRWGLRSFAQPHRLRNRVPRKRGGF